MKKLIAVRIIGLIFLISSSVVVFGQGDLKAKTTELEALKAREKELTVEIEQLTLTELRGLMKSVGYPVTSNEVEVIEHSAMVLGFACNYDMAAWTFHMLTPDVSFGSIARSNDFRVDDKVSCGTAVEADYFLRTEKSGWNAWV